MPRRMRSCSPMTRRWSGSTAARSAGAEVEAHLAGIFADHPTASYVWKVQEIRTLGDGVVLLRAIVGMVPPGRTEPNPATNAVQSLVAVGERIALFQNTPAQYHGRPEAAEAAHRRDPRGAPRT